MEGKVFLWIHLKQPETAHAAGSELKTPGPLWPGIVVINVSVFCSQPDTLIMLGRP